MSVAPEESDTRQRGRILVSQLWYSDNNGNEHSISGCYFPNVHAKLPPTLPALLAHATPLYDILIHDIEGKGHAMFAAQKITTGQLVVVERPLTIMPVSIPRDLLGFSINDVFGAVFNGLVDYDKEQFMELTNRKGDDIPEWQGISATNSLEIPLEGNDVKYANVIPTYGAIFPTISRVNHSCAPNAVTRFDHKTFTMFLRAVRPIAKGEEITISYCAPELPHVERTREIQQKYAFCCTCPGCIISPSNSDAARRKIVTWPQNGLTYERWLEQPSLSPSVLINEAYEMLALIKEEGLEGVYSFRHYYDLTRCHGAIGQLEEMRRWGWEALMHCNAGNGAESCDQLVETLIGTLTGLLMDSHEQRTL